MYSISLAPKETLYSKREWQVSMNLHSGLWWVHVPRGLRAPLYTPCADSPLTHMTGVGPGIAGDIGGNWRLIG